MTTKQQGKGRIIEDLKQQDNALVIKEFIERSIELNRAWTYKRQIGAFLRANN